MSESEKGYGAGIAQALDAAGPLEIAAPRQEQLPLPSTAEPDAQPAAAEAQPAARGAGRPAGSPNRRTAEIRDYLLAKYPHPLIGLCEMYARDTKALAQHLDCSPLEALKVQQSAALGALPYLEAKMPQAVDVNANGSLTLVLEGFNPTKTRAVEEGGGLVIEGTVEELAPEGESE